jgi:hypothetical protein
MLLISISGILDCGIVSYHPKQRKLRRRKKIMHFKKLTLISVFSEFPEKTQE